MAEKQMFVVAYDISNDRRRTRLHKRLLDFGSPVQYSVFECLLTAQEYRQMKKAVRRLIRPRLDRVRYYPICKSCRDKIETIGSPEVSSEPDSLVV